MKKVNKRKLDSDNNSKIKLIVSVLLLISMVGNIGSGHYQIC